MPRVATLGGICYTLPVQAKTIPPFPTTDEIIRSVLYSEELSIPLEKSSDPDLFRWFLASVLFGARISEGIARKTYWSFERHNLLDPGRILEAGWDFLVNPIMREGGYIRYDEKTSRQILRNCEMLLGEYGGSLSGLHEAAQDAKDLEHRLYNFYGVGPVTVNIFLRELRPFWEKANPEPLAAVIALAERCGIDLSLFDRKSLTFARLEAGLIRMRKLAKQW